MAKIRNPNIEIRNKFQFSKSEIRMAQNPKSESLKIRNPNIEIRNKFQFSKSEIRNKYEPKPPRSIVTETPGRHHRRARMYLEHSDFEFVSDFDIRISDFL